MIRFYGDVVHKEKQRKFNDLLSLLYCNKNFLWQPCLLTEYKIIAFIRGQYYKTLHYLTFQSFGFERIWWRLFQKLVVHTWVWYLRFYYTLSVFISLDIYILDCIVMHGKTGTVTGDTVSYCSHDINLSSTTCISLTVSNLQNNEHQRKYSKSFHKCYIFVSIDLLIRIYSSTIQPEAKPKCVQLYWKVLKILYLEYESR
jgi:uncharacterized protein YlbG (UPF0298 family)